MHRPRAVDCGTLGDSLARPEIDHVHRADRADIRQTRPDRLLRTDRLVGRGDAADQHVGDFRRRQIDEPRQQPESPRFSIDLPPTPVAWKTRQSKSPSRRFEMACTAGVVTPNIVIPIAGRARRGGFPAPQPSAIRRSFPPGHARRCRNLLGDRIEPLNVGHGMQHHDIGGSDIAADLA